MKAKHLDTPALSRMMLAAHGAAIPAKTKALHTSSSAAQRGKYARSSDIFAL